MDDPTSRPAQAHPAPTARRRAGRHHAGRGDPRLAAEAAAAAEAGRPRPASARRTSPAVPAAPAAAAPRRSRRPPHRSMAAAPAVWEASGRAAAPAPAERLGEPRPRSRGPAPGYAFGGAGERLVAYIVDGLLIGALGDRRRSSWGCSVALVTPLLGVLIWFIVDADRRPSATSRGSGTGAGQTPGLELFGMRVVRDRDGGPVSVGAAILRLDRLLDRHPRLLPRVHLDLRRQAQALLARPHRRHGRHQAALTGSRLPRTPWTGRDLDDPARFRVGPERPPSGWYPRRAERWQSGRLRRS